MSNNLVHSFKLAALIAFVTINAEAQVQSESSINLDQIYVIEEKNQSGLIDAPVKVEILTKEDIQKQQYQNLGESIKDLPGVNTAQISRRASGNSALIQGFGENSVLIMIDNTPVSQNSSFGFDLDQLSTEDIEKIEVIKGGASALYGSQAIGGVINIVTKKATKRPQLSLELSGALSENQSTENALNDQNLKVGYRGTGFFEIGTKASFALNKKEEIELDPDSIAQDAPDQQSINGSLEFSKKLNRHDLSLKYFVMNGLNTNHASRPYSSNGFGPSITQTKTTTQSIKLSDLIELNNGRILAIVNRDQTDDRLALNDNPLTPFTETLKQTEFETRRFYLSLKDYQLSNHKLSMGLLYHQDIVDQETTVQAVEDIVVTQKDIDDKEISSVEGFVQDNFFVGNFEISPGVRVQKPNQYELSYSPKINTSYYYDFPTVSSKTWLTIGTGYRTPSVKERFFTLDHSSVANYIVIGNEELRPEKSISFQLGQELKWNKKFSLYGNLFTNIVTDLIEATEVDSSTSGRVFTYQNLNEVLSRGVEVGSKWSPTPKWNFNLNYTYTEIVNQQNNLFLANRPMYSSRINTTYQLNQKTNLVNQISYHGKLFLNEENTETSEDYILVNLKANHQYNKRLNLFASLNNIFDVTKDPTVDRIIPISDQRPAIGRNILFGLNMNYGGVQ